MMKLAALLAAAFLALGPFLGIVGIALILPAPSLCATAPAPSNPGGNDAIATAPPPPAHSVVFPLPEGTWIKTDVFGWRPFPDNPFHTGTDFAASDGTPILAAADGIVTVAEFSDAWGGLVVIEHSFDGKVIATAYAHSWRTGIHVSPGQHVSAGQHIADVGSSGLSTGAHLHFEVRPGGSYAPAVDAEPWLAAAGAIDLTGPDGEVPAQAGCRAPDDELEDDPADEPDKPEAVPA